MRRWLVLWWGDGEERTDKLGVELGQPGLALAVKDQECVDHGGGGEGCAGMFRGLWRTAALRRVGAGSGGGAMTRRVALLGRYLRYRHSFP